MKTILVCLTSAVIVAACSDPVAPLSRTVTLTLDAQSYAAGETISARLSNRSRSVIGYGACSLELERFIGGSWALVNPGPRPCIHILYTLAPGGALPLRVGLPSSLEPGTYRLRQEILPDTSLPSRYVRSDAFIVRAPT